MRKTIDIAKVIDTANSMLAKSQDDMRSEREGICALTETLLHSAGAYSGYSHLASAGIDYSILDAYNADPEGCGMTGAEACSRAFANADQTRRAYAKAGGLL